MIAKSAMPSSVDVCRCSIDGSIGDQPVAAGRAQVLANTNKIWPGVDVVIARLLRKHLNLLLKLLLIL